MEFIKHDVAFPAITFTNVNLLRRSVVGGSLVTIAGLAPFVSSSAEHINYTYARCFDVSKANDTLTKQLNFGYLWWYKVGKE